MLVARLPSLARGCRGRPDRGRGRIAVGLRGGRHRIPLLGRTGIRRCGALGYGDCGPLGYDGCGPLGRWRGRLGARRVARRLARRVPRLSARSSRRRHGRARGRRGLGGPGIAGPWRPAPHAVCGGVPTEPWWRPDLEGQLRTVGVADVDVEAVDDVDHRNPLAVDEHPVEAAVVDRHPAALVEAQHQVRSGDQRMGDADVGAQIAADHHVVAWREGACRPVVPNGQRGRGWSRHRMQLYRYRARASCTGATASGPCT